tara:strand:+ start:270 stop:1043 length:774 start_codon:yes stop_codon:yes gene_type:complete
MDKLYNKIKENNFIISGPCVLEDYDTSLNIANFANTLCKKYGFTYIFKASFDKANRTSINSSRGMGLEKSKEIFKELSKQFYTTTDIHTPDQANEIADYVDIIQIPAFLSRQTDILTSAGETNKIINIKKFQLLSGKDMVRPVEKILSTNNNKIILTERGTLIPYGNMIVDLKNLVDMVNLGYPVVMDCTHACQELNPGQNQTSGRKEMASIYGQAALACGVKGFFAEIHKNPEKALSDKSTTLNFNEFNNLINKIK